MNDQAKIWKCSKPSQVVLIEPNNQNALQYAVGFASALDLPISVYIGSKKLPPETLESNSLIDIQRSRIRSLIPGAEVITSLDYKECIIVSNRFARLETSGRNRKGLAILAPQGENSFNPYKKKKILVPIGRVETAMKALCQAIIIAQSTDSALVLYHTTRPKPGCDSPSWTDHMHNNAREMLKAGKEICDQEGIDYEIDITSVYPDLICTGITSAAFDHDCYLIVMAIANDVVFGSHSTQILDFSPIPVLVIE